MRLIKPSSFQLLSSNPKVAKGESLGYLTFILHLAPSTLASGDGHKVNTCPFATKGCAAACLNLSGRGRIAKGGHLTVDEVQSGERLNSVQRARIRRTRWYMGFDGKSKSTFMLRLEREIASAIAYAEEEDMIPVFRLNGTSDILWERQGFVAHNGAKYRSMMHRFPNVQFYDYTKVPVRYRKDLPSNYRLTFSLADGNETEALNALQAGYSVAAVLRLKPNEPKPERFWGYPAIDADKTDLRFLDPAGTVAALSCKGSAYADTTGFVREVDEERPQ